MELAEQPNKGVLLHFLTKWKIGQSAKHKVSTLRRSWYGENTKCADVV